MNTKGIHVIWTTYMTWPPGDARGHWSPLFDMYGQLIEQGHKLNVPHRPTLERALNLAKEPERVLSVREQGIVANTIGDLIYHEFDFDLTIYAATIERTHVHLLLGPVSRTIEDVVGRLKGRTSSEVIALGEEPARRRTWSEGYWKVFVFELRPLLFIQRYIENHNTRRGMRAAPYQWITPFVMRDSAGKSAVI